MASARFPQIVVFDGASVRSFTTLGQARRCFDRMVERGATHVRMHITGREWPLRDFQGAKHSASCWCLGAGPFGRRIWPALPEKPRKTRPPGAK
jgi:hypothetical protein